MNAVAEGRSIPPATVPATARRVAWPVGAGDTRLPAKPMRRPDAPALIWRAVMSCTWRRLRHGMTPRPAPRPVWC